MAQKAEHYNIDWLTKTFESGTTINFLHFWGHTNKYNEETGKFSLSQWFECPFTVNNITYKTAEHWMMAHKSLLFGDKVTFNKIIDCDAPANAKELGRQVIGFDDHIWKTGRFDIVKTGNIHKFNQHPKLASYLLSTDNNVIVEASPVDTIWGIGLSPDSKDVNNIYAWRGENLLGFALMEARDFLRGFGHFEPLKNRILPPWEKFPNTHPSDMFWRMGIGEDYLSTYMKFHNALTEREKTIFQLTYPEPYEWRE